MSRTMISRPICTPCAGSGIEALILGFDDEEAEECWACGGTGYDPRILESATYSHSTTEDYA